MTPWPTNSASRATTLILQLFLLSDTPTVIHSQQLSRFTFSKMQIEYQFKFCILYSFFMSTHSSPFRKLSPSTEATSSCSFISCTAQLCRLYKVCNLHANLFLKDFRCTIDTTWNNYKMTRLYLLMSHFLLLIKEHERKLLQTF